MKRSLLALFLLFISYFGSAQVNIPGGYVSGLWSETLSPYIINGDIEVPIDSALVIESGVEIRFNGFYQFVVRGNLMAVGTEQDSIRFTTTDTVSWWHGLKFYDISGNEKDTCVIKYCKMTKGKTTGGSENSGGGAIHIEHSDKIKIENCLLTDNYASNGGGILIYYGIALIMNCVIENNEADMEGGGICFEAGSANIIGCKILDNHAWAGGGVSLHGSLANIENSVIRGNSDHIMAGGILTSYGTGPTCKNVLIEENTSGGTGGIEVYHSDIWMEDVTIRHNWGDHSGGIYIDPFSNLNFSPTNRCNVYMNYSYQVQDIRSSVTEIYDIILDTFTVMQPDEFLVSPLNAFDFDILNSKAGDQAEGNLYISPNGADTNSGMSIQEPMKTIEFAVRKIIANEVNPPTIFMNDGIYSDSLTGEYFPIMLKSNINVSAVNSQLAIIDAEGKTSGIAIYERAGISVKNLRIINGFSSEGGGIFATGFNIRVDSCLFSNNYASDVGGGIYMACEGNSSVTNCDFIDNNSFGGGGGCMVSGNSSVVENCRFMNNHASGDGGAIIIAGDSKSINDCLFLNNHAEYGGGAVWAEWCNSLMLNNTFQDNWALYGSSIFCISSNCQLVNSIIWDDSVQSSQKIYLYGENDGDYYDFTFDHSNLKDSNNIYKDENYNLHWGEGNIFSDPYFEDPINNNMQLMDNSPCINAGTPDVTAFNLPEMDLAGNLRIVNDTVDMGCYENQLGVGVEQTIVPLDFQVYPNPNDGDFYIRHSEKILHLTIYDLIGKTIFSHLLIDRNPFEVNLNGIEPGIYILEIESSDDILVSKIIVERPNE